jgi:hypothetical protein
MPTLSPTWDAAPRPGRAPDDELTSLRRLTLVREQQHAEHHEHPHHERRPRLPVGGRYDGGRQGRGRRRRGEARARAGHRDSRDQGRPRRRSRGPGRARARARARRHPTTHVRRRQRRQRQLQRVRLERGRGGTAQPAPRRVFSAEMSSKKQKKHMSWLPQPPTRPCKHPGGLRISFCDTRRCQKKNTQKLPK